ncbi:MAG: twin-arginine translocase TatA/TatE family subunit [Candidatus Thermoplasmatota archaeon]
MIQHANLYIQKSEFVCGDEMGFFGLGGVEIIIIVVAFLLLFFGAKKIPEFARGLGRAFGEFKRGKAEVESEIQNTEKQSDIFRAAKSLGINTEGKTEEELKEEILKKLKSK